MKRKGGGAGRDLGATLAYRDTYNPLVRRVRDTVICLGIVGAFVAHERCDAQATSWPGRLTVRPQAMATGTRTLLAGEQALDSLPEYLVYVPTQCVGTRRVPLVVFLPAEEDAREVIAETRQFADKYGMIVLAPTAAAPGRWDLIRGLLKGEVKGWGDPQRPGLIKELPHDTDVKNIDAALKQVLRKFAIAPDKIALTGMSDGGAYTLFLGRNNVDVFSRIAPMSPSNYLNGTSPQHKTTQFFFSGGVNEGGFLQYAMIAAHDLEQQGYAVRQTLVLRLHEDDDVEIDSVFHWFKESWATPTPTARRSVSQAGATAVPLLTVEAFTKMHTFWKLFWLEPDSIQTDGRTAYQKSITVRVGQRELSVIDMLDIPALAVRYPSVAADLRTVGLTAQQEEAYRAALISAKATESVSEDSSDVHGWSGFRDRAVGTIDAHSVLGKNVAFLRAHWTELSGVGGDEGHCTSNVLNLVGLRNIVPEHCHENPKNPTSTTVR